VIRRVTRQEEGSLVAKLVDKKGSGTSGRKVHFYVQPSGSATLDDVMNSLPQHEWIVISGVLGIRSDTWLGSAMTDTEGRAVINYLALNSFNAEKIGEKLLKDGKVEGQVRAVIVDEEELRTRQVTQIEYMARADVRLDCIARMFDISGDGRSDEFKQAYLKENPEDKWGTGRVRVKRMLAQPTFDYAPVNAGFGIMPGDILDIDGDVEVKIGWVTGDIAIVRVPHQHQFKGSRNMVEHVRLPILRCAYESGFQTSWERTADVLIGFSIQKGIQALIDRCVPESVKFCMDVLNAFENEVDFSKIEEFARIRVRSRVIVDTIGEEVQVYTIEGNPDIRTIKGTEITLNSLEMVTLSADGSISDVKDFDPETELEGWSEYLEVGGEGQEGSDGDTGKSGEYQLPEWFETGFPFLLPFARPLLPLLPESLRPIVPYVVLVAPVLLMLLVLGVLRRKPRDEED